jgi:hypothetical protein
MGVLFFDDFLIAPNIQIAVRACRNEYIFEERNTVKNNLSLALLRTSQITGNILIPNLNKIRRVLNIIVLKDEHAIVLPLGHVVVAAEEEGELRFGEKLYVVDGLLFCRK